MPNATIKLSTPIEGHESQIAEVILREPRFGDVMSLGEPAAYARSEGGLLFTSDRDEVIKAYIDRLLVQPSDPALLMQCSLADTMKLRGAIFDFFRAARQENSPET